MFANVCPDKSVRKLRIISVIKLLLTGGKAKNADPDQSEILRFFLYNTVKPVFSDNIKRDIFLAFQTGGYLLLHENSAESSYVSFLHYFHPAISNHMSVAMLMSPE